MKTALCLTTLLIGASMLAAPALAKGGGGGHSSGGGAHAAGSASAPAPAHTGGHTASVRHGSYYGRGGRGRYWGYNGDDTDNQGSAPPSNFQSSQFSGPAFIGPAGYSNYVQSYSWPQQQ